MEDTNKLSMQVLRLHFKNRMDILNTALQEVRNYSRKDSQSQEEYEAVTAMMDGVLHQLPEDFVRYFLCLIPLPGGATNAQLRTYDHDKIKRILINYLESDDPSLPPITENTETSVPLSDDKQTTNEKIVSVADLHSVHNRLEFSALSTCKKRRFKRIVSPGLVHKPPTKPMHRRVCKPLLDICSKYIVENHAKLNQDYQSRNVRVWQLLNDSGKFDAEEMKKLYEIGRDLNKKLKWLRLLDAEEISEEIIYEAYFDEDVFVQKSEMRAVLTEEPFVVSDVLQKAIESYVAR